MMLPLATNAARQDGGLRRGFVKIFCRPATGVVIGGVVVAPDGLRADPADRARRAEPAHRRASGAHVLGLPVAVRFDHRGRPASSCATTTWTDPKPRRDHRMFT